MKPLPHERIAAESTVTGPAVRWALSSLSLSMLLASLGTSIANVGLPTLSQEFSVAFHAVQWVVLAYLLAITTLIVSVGRLGDLIGRRRLLLAGIVLFTVASGLCGLAPSLGLLIAARVAQGLGAAIMMALTLACVGEAVPKSKTGSAMGLLGTMSAIGTALGPTLGGVLITGFGWPAIFLVMVPLGVLSLVLAHRFLPGDTRAASTEPIAFDHVGTVLLGMTLAAYALAMTLGHGDFGPLNFVLLVAAIGGLGLFIFAQKQASVPLINVAMFRNPVLSAGFAMSALVTTVVMATLVVGPFYLSGAMALDAAWVGLVMSTGPIVAALAGVPAGHLIDRFGSHGMTVIGLSTMAAGAAILPLVPIRLGVVGYIAPLVLITAGYAFFQAANNTAIMRVVAPTERGVASGMLNLSRNLGLITGASAMGALYAYGSTTSQVTTGGPEAVAAGMRTTFAFGAALIAIAIAIAWVSHVMAQRDVRRLSPDNDRCHA